MSAKYRIPVGNGEKVVLDEAQGRLINSAMAQNRIVFPNKESLRQFLIENGRPKLRSPRLQSDLASGVA